MSEARFAASQSGRQVLALAWLERLPRTPANDAAAAAFASSQVWGHEYAHLLAQALRARGIRGTVVRGWWTACPAGTGAGPQDFRT